MPLYELKIDKSLMRDTPHDHNGTAIVQSILSMAGHLGLRVVADGARRCRRAPRRRRRHLSSRPGRMVNACHEWRSAASSVTSATPHSASHGIACSSGACSTKPAW